MNTMNSLKTEEFNKTRSSLLNVRENISETHNNPEDANDKASVDSKFLAEKDKSFIRERNTDKAILKEWSDRKEINPVLETLENNFVKDPELESIERVKRLMNRLE